MKDYERLLMNKLFKFDGTKYTYKRSKFEFIEINVKPSPFCAIVHNIKIGMFPKKDLVGVYDEMEFKLFLNNL